MSLSFLSLPYKRNGMEYLESTRRKARCTKLLHFVKGQSLHAFIIRYKKIEKISILGKPCQKISKKKNEKMGLSITSAQKMSDIHLYLPRYFII